MTKTGTRMLFGRGKGYLSAAGPQSRFILFLLILLGVYTFLLKVFQKLAEIVQLPVFLPIALITLLFFIGVAGTMYSHTFTGPVVRIRRTLEQMAEGETNVSLRLRDADDPLLKDLVRTISRLCEHSRSSHGMIQETVNDLLADTRMLQEKVQQGADKAVLLEHLNTMCRKHDVLDKAIKSSGMK
jgi:hypothetical protein